MHGSQGPSFVRIAHARHHRDPSSLTWRGSFVFGGAFLVALAGGAALGTLLLGRAVWMVAIGVGLGSIAYSLSHRYAHSAMFRPSDESGSTWNAHLRHHDRDARTNFGFTTRFWDRVFGTAADNRPVDT